MKEILFLLRDDEGDAAQEAVRELKSAGGRVSQSFGRGALVVSADEDEVAEAVRALKTHPGVAGVYESSVPEDVLADLRESERLGASAWNERQKDEFREAKKQRKGEGLSWGHPDFEREGRID